MKSTILGVLLFAFGCCKGAPVEKPVEKPAQKKDPNAVEIKQVESVFSCTHSSDYVWCVVTFNDGSFGVIRNTHVKEGWKYKVKWKDDINSPGWESVE